MLSLSEVSVTLCYIRMSGEVQAKKLHPKIQNRFIVDWLIVDSFCLAGLDRIVWGKGLIGHMWACYINKNHPLSDASIVDTTMEHHDVLYNPTLQHIYLNRKMNDEGVFHHYLTGENMSTIHCYQVRKSMW